MNKLALILLLLLAYHAPAQVENIIIVTTDGFRWQEVFTGMDSSLAAMPKYNQGDSAGIFRRYWSPEAAARRQRLMPFLWGTVAKEGQVYGNRLLGTNVNVANPYWFSYPGYSEIFCGFADTAINSNAYPPNPNTNLLEFINKQQGYQGKVAAFCAWDAFSRILNEKRSGIPVICGSSSCGGDKPDAEEQLINHMHRDAYDPFDDEPLDVFTHYAAMDHLKKKKPSVLYISYGETDDWAHAGHYKDYLDAANQVDAWLKEIWGYVQSTPAYRNKTALFFTADHGRGTGDKWTSHNKDIPGAGQIWFAVLGPGILPKGEISGGGQLYQQQFAQTVANLLGLDFTCGHPVSAGFKDLLVK